ncbi:hypothetical protein FHQ18_01185 [Deferribacter autotrophicus]|uniref:Uncharacterized protein n=1 Tax=Deferribacter autotrophicus TaxID=500465 RepID=A0A5A8F7T2_9BACT|nr:SOS response-associated peptidase family protein [Deferribacter autotrophicus]KAA0259519.1 hypothetical protein FHQ18_01185 [Deferribacter autotrophicus]
MCAGLLFRESLNKTEFNVFFPRPYAKIHFINETGEKDIALWGLRNEKEKEELKVDLPITGWAKIESIKKGYWNKFNPQKVYIPAIKFMEKDSQKKSHWFELKDNEFILALLVKQNNIKVCYIITKPAPEKYKFIHDRWVLITSKTAFLKEL